MSTTQVTLPPLFLEKLSEFIPKDKLDSVLASFETPKPVSFRVNTLKAKTEDVVRELSGLGFDIEQIVWYKEAFLLQNKSQSELLQTDIYKKGLIYIQNLSSMIPPLVLDPKPDEHILDLAAAPGSKTTQIATLMQNCGEIIANDVSRARLYKLSEVLKHQGVNIARTILADGKKLWQKDPEYFDRTLLDAPCTMEGRFLTSDPKTYEDWKQKKVKLLATLQGYLLRSAIAATHVEGTIVYSTCTLSPEENEGVIDWILQREKDTIELEAIEIPGLAFDPGITSWEKRTYDEKVSLCARIYPSKEMEGFFIAKIKKVGSSLERK